MSHDPTAEKGASAAPPIAGPDPIIGKEIDGCTIVRKIGQGGMGIVYLAEHSKLRQQYVVKILNPALTAAEDTIQRFFREAQSVARLNHPSIVGIQNVGQEGEYYYIRMEYVDGDTVENIVKEQKKLDWKLATKIILETAEALSHAHKKGTIHRDIKPENIMLTKLGEVKVMDFGLAKQVQAATKVSVTGQIVGTPFFMSPEQAGGKTVDARSDIYSLGVSYYYMLTGVKPFNGKNLQEIFLKHFFYTPESPKIYTPELPENVCEIIRRCLKKKKKERYQSAAQLSKDLAAILSGGELSAAESSDGAPDGPSASSPDMRASNLDLGKTASGRIVAQVSEPGMGGDTVSRDLAAAQAELGAGEPGTIVAQGGGGETNGSATVIAKALAGADAPPAEDAPVAPLTKRNRVALTAQQAGASLVFQPGKAPLQSAGPSASDVDLTAPPPVAPPPSIESVGNSTVKLDPVKKGPTPTPTIAPARPARTIKILGVVGTVVALLGGYELAGMSRYSGLEDQYSKVQLIHPEDDNVAAWTELKGQWTSLAEGYEKFGSTFRLTPTGGDAEGRAVVCRNGEKMATDGLALAEKIQKQRKKDEETARTIREHEAENLKKLDELLARIKKVVPEKGYDQAVDCAREAAEIAKALNKRMDEVKAPFEVTSDIPAKIVNGATNEELGAIATRGGTAVVMVPWNDKTFRLEVRKAHFKTWTYSQPVTSFVRERAILEREVKFRFPLGKTDDMNLFRHTKANEPLKATAPLALDTQAPASLDVICEDGALRSYEVRNGRPRWSKQQAVGLYGDRMPGPEILAGKAIVSATPEGLVSAHDVPTGSVVCEARLGAPIVAAPRIDANARYVVAGTVAGDIVCLDIANPVNHIAIERWRVTAEGSILTQPLIQGTRVIVGSLDDKLRVLDLNSGKLLATYDAREAICAGPIALGDQIYLGTREGRVHAVSITTNGERTAVVPIFTTAPAGSEILQLVTSGKGVFYATKNDVRSTDPLGNKIFDPFTPTDGGVPLDVVGIVPMNDALGIATADGFVFSIDATRGRENWKLDLKAKVKVPPVFDGDLHVATESGEIVTISGD